MKIGVLGTGSVASALATGWVRARHTVVLGSRDPAKAKVPAGTAVKPPREAVEASECVVLAVPYSAADGTLKAVGTERFGGKILIDATNALNPSYELALGFSTSGAEELAKKVPGAKVVKAFNTVFAENMSTGRIGGTPLAALVAGDDAAAKEAVLQLAKDLGFDPVDAGPLKSARYLEPMGMQLIHLGYGLKMGPKIGLALVR